MKRRLSKVIVFLKKEVEAMLMTTTLHLLYC